MKLRLLAIVSLTALASSHGWAATSINCKVNPETGAVEATAPWRNSLGSERADGICKAAGAPPSRSQPTMAPPAAVAPQSPAFMAGPAPVNPGAPAPLMAMPQPAPVAAMASMAVPMAPIAPALQPQAPVAPAAMVYAVAPSDVNFRRVLTRWARASGWTFDLEHWAVSKDIPVGGADATALDFKAAVRRLLKSTLLNDTPVQPCFYSNKVLRVIPATELCSRSQT